MSTVNILITKPVNLFALFTIVDKDHCKVCLCIAESCSSPAFVLIARHRKQQSPPERNISTGSCPASPPPSSVSLTTAPQQQNSLLSQVLAKPCTNLKRKQPGLCFSSRDVLPSQVFCPVCHQVKKSNTILSSFFFLKMLQQYKVSFLCIVHSLRCVFCASFALGFPIIVSSLWLLQEIYGRWGGKCLLAYYLYMRGMLV